MTTSLFSLARLLRTAGPLPENIRYRLNILDNTVEACGPNPNQGCKNALENNARERIREVEEYLATQPGIVFPTPAGDPPMVHPGWEQSAPALA